MNTSADYSPANQEFRDSVREALGDRNAWEDLTAPTEMARNVLPALLDIKADVRAQRAKRRPALSEIQGMVSTGDAKPWRQSALERETAEWRGRVAFFEKLLDARIAELQKRFGRETQGFWRRRSKSGQGLFQTLAMAIHLHQLGQVDDAWLYGLLDELEFDFGGNGVMSLRDAIEDGVISPESTPAFLEVQP